VSKHLIPNEQLIGWKTERICFKNVGLLSTCKLKGIKFLASLHQLNIDCYINKNLQMYVHILARTHTHTCTHTHTHLCFVNLENIETACAAPRFWFLILPSNKRSQSPLRMTDLWLGRKYTS
jgi:hypothetical protein